MTEQQFQRILRNHQWRSTQLLADESRMATLLRVAAVKVRRRESGVGVWQQVAEPAWLPITQVKAVDGDTLIVGVRDAAYLGELRRRATSVARAVARLLPGVRRVQFVLSDEHRAAGT